MNGQLRKHFDKLISKRHIALLKSLLLSIKSEIVSQGEGLMYNSTLTQGKIILSPFTFYFQDFILLENPIAS